MRLAKEQRVPVAVLVEKALRSQAAAALLVVLAAVLVCGCHARANVSPGSRWDEFRWGEGSWARSSAATRRPCTLPATLPCEL